MSDTPAVEVHGLTKTFGRSRALDGLDLTVPAGQVAGFLGPERRRQVHHDPRPARAAARRRRPVRLLGGDPWDDAVALHRRLAYVPGDVTLWPNLTGGEAIDLLGRLRGGDRPAPPGRAARAVRARPDQEGAHVLQGQPAEGRAGRGARRRRRAARSRRAHLRAGPADGGGVHRVRPRGEGGRPVGAAVQPHPGRGREALRHRHDHPQRPHRGVAARSPSCATSPAPPSPRRPTPTRPRWPGCPACTTWPSHGGRVTFDVDDEHLDAVVRALGALGVRSLMAAPPSLEELFLRHYGDELAAPGCPRRDRGRSRRARDRAADSRRDRRAAAVRAAPGPACGWRSGCSRSAALTVYAAVAWTPPTRPRPTGRPAPRCIATRPRSLLSGPGYGTRRLHARRDDRQRARARGHGGRRDHVDPARRPAHPGRGGVRPGRAGPRAASSAGAPR